MRKEEFIDSKQDVSQLAAVRPMTTKVEVASSLLEEIVHQEANKDEHYPHAGEIQQEGLANFTYWTVFSSTISCTA